MRSLSEVLDEEFEFGPCFVEQRIPPTESLVEELENEIGISLPKDYRSFLLRYGGTTASLEKGIQTAVWVATRGDFYVTSYVLGFYSPDPRPHLQQQLDVRHTYKNRQSQIGASFLPIMEGTQYELFCLKLTGERKGSVWAWIKDPVALDTKWDDIQDEWGLYFVAPDVTSFVCSFQEYK
jgi:hypothetical protein